MSEVVRTTSQLPTDYKPEEGIKRMTIAEAAATYYEKAKDAEGLRDALIAKMTEQRNFIIWWDNVANKDPGGGGTHPLNTPLPTSEKGVPND